MHRIKNYEALASTPARRDALDIIEAGFAAIDTATIVRNSIRLSGSVLAIGTKTYDLNAYRHIHVLGFGKASCQAAAALDALLGNRVHRGIALGAESSVCHTIDICEATHPLPSQRNFELSEQLVKECETVGAEDLVLVIVSGGGSAMLCWPASECEQGVRLYEASLRKGLAIKELNTVRKHLSLLKGGGLAKLLYPATVIGLLFSDVPGAAPEMVASGPTYLDNSTIAAAQTIIDRYDLGTYELLETPKDPALFRNVTNLVLVSNETALQAMMKTAQTLGYDTEVIAPDLFDEPSALVARFVAAARPHSIILGGGESHFIVPADAGRGGRNQRVALTGVASLRAGQLFASIASDGTDNNDCAGALIDDATIGRATEHGFDTDDALRTFDEHGLLEKTGDLVFTGPTGANVSDLMFLLTP